MNDTPYLLEGKDITHHDIYKTLEHNGYNLISHVPLRKGRVISIEELVTEILAKSTQIREVEALPFVLTYANFNPSILAEMAIYSSIEKKTGFICDLASAVQTLAGECRNRWELDTASHLLYPYRGNDEISLINGIDESLKEKMKMHHELEGKWNIIGCLDIDDITKQMKRYMAFSDQA